MWFNVALSTVFTTQIIINTRVTVLDFPKAADVEADRSLTANFHLSLPVYPHPSVSLSLKTCCLCTHQPFGVSDNNNILRHSDTLSWHSEPPFHPRCLRLVTELQTPSGSEGEFTSPRHEWFLWAWRLLKLQTPRSGAATQYR